MMHTGIRVADSESDQVWRLYLDMVHAIAKGSSVEVEATRGLYRARIRELAVVHGLPELGNRYAMTHRGELMVEPIITEHRSPADNRNAVDLGAAL